jgi:multisubunit Na+/H+ antiporter MnhF subunit
MDAIIENLLNLALLVHLLLLGIVVWRVWRGENVVDRLAGADLVATLTIAILVLLALIRQDSIYVEVALGLAALGFVGIIALARYLADEQMF